MEREKIKVVTRSMMTNALNVAASTYGAFIALASNGEAPPIRWQAKRKAPVVVVYRLTDIQRILMRACAFYSPAIAAHLSAQAFEIEVR